MQVINGIEYKYVTADGYPARILADNVQREYEPVVAAYLYEGVESVVHLSKELCLGDEEYTYLAEHDEWSDVKVDTPVWVRVSNGNGLGWAPMHFADKKGDVIYVFASGRTSHTHQKVGPFTRQSVVLQRPNERPLTIDLPSPIENTEKQKEFFVSAMKEAAKEKKVKEDYIMTPEEEAEMNSVIRESASPQGRVTVKKPEHYELMINPEDAEGLREFAKRNCDSVIITRRLGSDKYSSNEGRVYDANGVYELSKLSNGDQFKQHDIVGRIV